MTVKVKSISLVAAICLVAAVGAVSMASAEPGEKQDTQPVKVAGGTPGAVPVYRPPFRGAPSRRVSGGARGPASDLPVLAALAPEHTGLTTRKQPVLYWYVSKPVSVRLQLTLNEEGEFEPLLETDLSPPSAGGIQSFDLARHNISLVPGKTYQWFIALIPDPEQRSQDILAGGAIERVTPPASLGQKIAATDPSSRAAVYAEAGLWYDAVDSVSELIAAAPENKALRQQRAALMEQVNLPEVAEFDRR